MLAEVAPSALSLLHPSTGAPYPAASNGQYPPPPHPYPVSNGQYPPSPSILCSIQWQVPLRGGGHPDQPGRHGRPAGQHPRSKRLPLWCADRAVMASHAPWGPLASRVVHSGFINQPGSKQAPLPSTWPHAYCMLYDSVHSGFINQQGSKQAPLPSPWPYVYCMLF